MANKTTIYRLRDRRTGLFAPGGMPSRYRQYSTQWKKKGKIWTSLGALKCHLLQYSKHAAAIAYAVPSSLGPWSDYAEICADYLARVEIVAYDVVEAESWAVSGLDGLGVTVGNEAN